MKSRGRQLEVMIVGDTLAFGGVIRKIMENALKSSVAIRHTTYDRFRGMLTPRLIKTTQLFILELWRTYSTGLRAEGLAVAEQFMRLGTWPL
jgi:hypothetical protein